MTKSIPPYRVENPPTAEDLDKFLTLLRSGEHKQGHSRLRSTKDGNSIGPYITLEDTSSICYCCLGLYDEFIANRHATGTTCLLHQGRHFAFPRKIQDHLIDLNDEHECTFPQIADALESVLAEILTQNWVAVDRRLKDVLKEYLQKEE